MRYLNWNLSCYATISNGVWVPNTNLETKVSTENRTLKLKRTRRKTAREFKTRHKIQNSQGNFRQAATNRTEKDSKRGPSETEREETPASSKTRQGTRERSTPTLRNPQEGRPAKAWTPTFLVVHDHDDDDDDDADADDDDDGDGDDDDDDDDDDGDDGDDVIATMVRKLAMTILSNKFPLII